MRLESSTMALSKRRGAVVRGATGHATLAPYSWSFAHPLLFCNFPRDSLSRRNLHPNLCSLLRIGGLSLQSNQSWRMAGRPTYLCDLPFASRSESPKARKTARRSLQHLMRWKSNPLANRTAARTEQDLRIRKSKAVYVGCKHSRSGLPEPWGRGSSS